MLQADSLNTTKNCICIHQRSCEAAGEAGAEAAWWLLPVKSRRQRASDEAASTCSARMGTKRSLLFFGRGGGRLTKCCGSISLSLCLSSVTLGGRTLGRGPGPRRGGILGMAFSREWGVETPRTLRGPWVSAAEQHLCKWRGGRRAGGRDSIRYRYRHPHQVSIPIPDLY